MGVKIPGERVPGLFILISLQVPPGLQAVIIGSTTKSCFHHLYQLNKSIISTITPAMANIIPNTPI
jgi:hypothetical protein